MLSGRPTEYFGDSLFFGSVPATPAAAALGEDAGQEAYVSFAGFVAAAAILGYLGGLDTDAETAGRNSTAAAAAGPKEHVALNASLKRKEHAETAAGSTCSDRKQLRSRLAEAFDFVVDCADAPKCAKAKEIWHEATHHVLAGAVVERMDDAAVDHVLNGTDPGKVKNARDSRKPVVYKQTLECDAVTEGVYIGKADKDGRARQRHHDATVASGKVTQRVHRARVAFAGRPYHAIVLVEFPAADDDDWWQALFARLCPRTSAASKHPTPDLINTFLSQTEAAFVALYGTFQAGAAYVKSWETYFERSMPAIPPLNGTPATEGNYGRSTAATNSADAPTRRVLTSQIRNSLTGQPGGLPDCELISAFSARQVTWRVWLPGLEAMERLRLSTQQSAGLAINGEYEVSFRVEFEPDWLFCKRLTAAEREAVKGAKVWFRVRNKEEDREVKPWTPWEVASADLPSVALHSRI